MRAAVRINFVAVGAGVNGGREVRDEVTTTTCELCHASIGDGPDPSAAAFRLGGGAGSNGG